MKTVYLLRHAKSSWSDPSLSDFDRPLSSRGRKAAPRMGNFMAREGLIPERVLCSAARRALETWEMVSVAVGRTMPVEILRELYLASPGALLARIQALPQEESSVLFIGHNPTHEELAMALAGEGEADALASLERKYPTGALAVLDFSVQGWDQVEERRGYLRAFIRPKALK